VSSHNTWKDDGTGRNASDNADYWGSEGRSNVWQTSTRGGVEREIKDALARNEDTPVI